MSTERELERADADKEALERLKEAATTDEVRAATVITADLRALIAKQEGLEREVERLTEAYREAVKLSAVYEGGFVEEHTDTILRLVSSTKGGGDQENLCGSGAQVRPSRGLGEPGATPSEDR